MRGQTLSFDEPNSRHIPFRRRGQSKKRFAHPQKKEVPEIG